MNIGRKKKELKRKERKNKKKTIIKKQKKNLKQPHQFYIFN